MGLSRARATPARPLCRCTFPGCSKAFILEAKLRTHVAKAHGEALAAMTSLPSNAAAAKAAQKAAAAAAAADAGTEAGSDDE